tara:strand:- start:594 stop:2447 length:1854 start_codon:yes stop_codon:yes gene_type:complete
VAESIVTLRVEARNAISSLNKTSQATKTLSNSAKGATASLTTASAAAKGLGASLAASLGPLITLGAAFATVGNAIGTFTARERDIAILTQGLKNLGEGTVALNELQVAANKLGNQTLFNQEEFTRGFNLLTSFRNIGVNSYTRVAQAAADIAQVNQVDVSTSFMQLAKALQDPERNLSNLNRSGIAFTKTQTDVIKELMKTNKTAEAHAMILSIVEESYNQLAQAAAEGFAGNVDSLGEAFRDFSETLGKTLEPALIAVTKSLTALLKAANDFINSPIAVTATIFTGIALAAKGVSVALPLISAGLLKVAAAGGVATIALNAIPFVAIATAAGIFTTAIVKASQKQRDFNKALREGDEQALKSEFNRLFIAREKLLARISEAEESSNKRSLQSLKRQLAMINESIAPIKEKLDANRKTAKEIENQNEQLKKQEEIIKKNEEAAKKLKEKMAAVGQEIESNIKNNLADAIEGAQSFGDAMNNVLNKIKRKLLDLALDKMFEGFQDSFSGKEERKGIGGFLGDIIGGLFRANGGPVKAGQPYIVGERQPELFVPNRSGTIIPSVPSGGDSITNIVNVSVDASGSSVQGDGAMSQQLGQTIALVVQETLVREKRSGGLLA